MIRVLSVFGTRPEAIKMAPVGAALAAHPAIDSRVCVTAQHRAMLDDALALFGIVPDHDLDLMRAGQQPAEVAGAILAQLPALLAAERPDLVLVHGDTVTSTAAAWAASLGGVRIGHVEAGLRSHDRAMPFPEEQNRELTARLADLHFVPTPTARDNLLAERIDRASIVVTGNSGIDALLGMRRRMRDNASFRAACRARVPRLAPGRRLILVTVHRRENHARLEPICAALRTLAARGDVEIAWPVHPGAAVRAPVERLLGGTAGVRLLPPIDYGALVAMLGAAQLVLTDSGGLQEEAPTLGRPVLVLRDATERPEAIAAGAARLVGTDPARIVAEAERVLDDPSAYAAIARPRRLYGDGRAADRIVKAILSWHARAELHALPSP